LPDPQGATEATGRDPLRRRAADARHRPGAHVAAEALAPRRAVARPGPNGRAQDLRGDPGPEQGGGVGAPGGTERPPGTQAGPSRVRHGDGDDHRDRPGGSAAQRPADPGGVPGRMMTITRVESVHLSLPATRPRLSLTDPAAAPTDLVAVRVQTDRGEVGL